ncbi:MAG: helix-turn-helix domain-containing protein [Nitrospira sp.]|nr:helix-turn-helix domain-containing protein [Nitrospira sp.]
MRMQTLIERHIRVEEFANRTGLAQATIRKKIARREIAFHKAGRAVVIPESEVARVLGERHDPVSLMAEPVDGAA